MDGGKPQARPLVIAITEGDTCYRPDCLGLSLGFAASCVTLGKSSANLCSSFFICEMRMGGQCCEG